jgi:hypothetical protein
MKPLGKSEKKSKKDKQKGKERISDGADRQLEPISDADRFPGTTKTARSH